MLTNWIVAIAATSFLLGFMKPMYSPQAHALISMGTYLVMWFILSEFEKRKKPVYSNAPYLIFGFVLLIGALSVLASFVPDISEPILFVRAFVFIAALVYLFSSTARMYVDVWLAKLRKG
jgi:hypothetical protein